MAGSTGSGSTVDEEVVDVLGGGVWSLLLSLAWPLPSPAPLPFVLPLPLPLSFPLPLPCCRAALAAAAPCWPANELTQSPIPCPLFATWSLHLTTWLDTCCPQTAGFRLPVVAAPATVTAAAATAMPVRTLMVSAAPAPPARAFRPVRARRARRGGTARADTTSRTRCSSCSSTRSRALICTNP